MTRPFVLLALLCAACGSGDDASSQRVNRDTLTQRQKDSILAHSRVPGASGVKRAMAAADSASARARRADSVATDTSDR